MSHSERLVDGDRPRVRAILLTHTGEGETSWVCHICGASYKHVTLDYTEPVILDCYKCGARWDDWFTPSRAERIVLRVGCAKRGLAKWASRCRYETPNEGQEEL